MKQLLRQIYPKHAVSKSTFLVLLFFIAWMPIITAQTVSVGDVVATPGQNITVPVTFSGMTNINSFEFYFYFDPDVLTANNPPILNLPSNYEGAVLSYAQSNFIFVNFFVTSATNIPNGKLFDLSFTYQEGNTPISFSSEVLSNYQEISINSVFGSVSDGQVTQYALQVSTSGQGTVLVNGDPYVPGTTYPQGTALQLLANPNPGWTFNNWSGDQSGSNNPVTITMNSNKTVTANFIESVTPTQYTLTMNTTGTGSVYVNGTIYSGPRQINANTIVNIQAFPGSGYTFSNWSGDYSGTSTTGSFTMNGNKSITANFSQTTPPQQYTLTINYSGSGQVLVNGSAYTSPITVNENTNLNLQALASSGWTFSNWSGSLGGSANPTSIFMNGNKVITATFTQAPPPTTYTLTINTVGSGTVNVNGAAYNSTLTLAANTTVSLHALAPAGWSFSSWSGSLTGTNNPSSLLMNGNKIVTATFTETVAPQQYTLSIDITGNGEIRVNGTPYTNPVTVNAGTVLSLTHHTAEGWQFTGWGGDVTGTGSPVDINMNQDKNVSATFTQIPQTKYTLTADVFGGGKVVVDGDPYTVPIGYTEVSFPNLSAEPDPGWKFEGWGGNMSGNRNPTTLIVNTNKYITATFSELPNTPYTLTIDITGQGIVRVNGEVYTEPMTIIIGTSVLIESEPMPGWLFTGYAGDISFDGNTLQFVMEGDRSLTASFAAAYQLNVVVSPGNIGATTSGSGQYVAGQTVDLLAMAPEGYFFTSWSGAASNIALLSDPSSPVATFTMPARNATLTANFAAITPPSYALSLQAEPGNIGAVVNGAGSYTENTIVQITASQVEGYTFSGWTGMATDLALLSNPMSASTSIIMPARAVSLTAVYSMIPLYTLSLAAEPAGIGATLTGSGTYPEGEQVDISASVVEGYTFSGWTGTASDLALLGNPMAASTTLTMPGRQLSLTAVYETIPQEVFALNLQTSPAGLGASLTGNGNYEAGEEVVIAAGAVAGYTFSGWTGPAADLALLDNTASASTSLDMPARNLSFTATYSENQPEQYTLTISITGNGTVQVNGETYTGPVTANEGTQLSLLAEADDNWQFSGWSGALNGNNPAASLTMNGNKQVSVTFTEIPPTTFDVAFLVLDTNGQPIENAIVIFNGNAYPPGKYTFNNLDSGTYTFTIIASGYLNANGSISVFNADVNVPVTMIRSTVDVNEPEAQTSIRVFPNPASQVVNIEAEEAIGEIRVINMLGKVMMTANGNRETSVKLDVGHFDPGLYFIQVLTANSLHTLNISVY